MPELPEVEITARRLDGALRGARVESALAPGINALQDVRPAAERVEGAAIAGVRRRGKHLVVDLAGDLALLVHLMSAGRLQLYDKRASTARPHVAPARAHRRRARAAPARVRHQAGARG